MKGMLMGLALLAGAHAAAGREASSSGEAKRPRLAGHSLAEALELLQAKGLRLVFSDQLVRPEMRVETEPRAGSLPDALRAILSPHGLDAREGPGRLWVVVRGRAGGELRGRVLDAQTGESLAKAQVAVRSRRIEALTDEEGRFLLRGLEPGEAELTVTAVGYGMIRRVVRLGAVPLDLVLRLNQYALRASEEVLVSTAPFEPRDPAAPSAHPIAGTDLKNLASVLVDDPLRSVQSLPGVAADDDYKATFAIRGMGLSALGYYLDGVPMNPPLHTIRDFYDGFSLTILNGDVVDSLSLVSGAPPARFGDRTGAALDVRTREGNRESVSGRLSLGAMGAYATLEGPLGPGKKGSWLLSARKSYLDYVLKRIDAEGTILGFHDVTAKLAHHPSPAHTVSLFALHGRSHSENGVPDQPQEELGRALAATQLATLKWRYLPSERLSLESSTFLVRETAANRSIGGTETLRADLRQWGWRADAAVSVGPCLLEGGLLFRGLSDASLVRDFFLDRRRYVVVADYDAEARQQGAFLQATWRGLGDRVLLTLGGRRDRFDATGETRWVPRASVSLAVSPGTRLIGASGAYAQFPTLAQLRGRHGNPELRAERTQQTLLAVEQLVGHRLRLRLEAYQTRARDLIFDTDAEWRMVGGVVWRDPSATLHNVLHGRHRGLEVTLERRTVNGVTGWIAYALASARAHEPGTSLSFDTDHDQRHTVTAFASSRLSPTLNVSGRLRYGSGTPVPGFYRATDEALLPRGLFLADERNTFRPGGYRRLDLRFNKAFPFERWKVTLHGEVINFLDQRRYRYGQLGVLNPNTGGVVLRRTNQLPFLPAIGVTAEF